MHVSESALQRALDQVAVRFPFPGYLDPLRRGTEDIVRTVSLYLPAGSRVLDFGGGPADKSAVLAILGYKCTAMDQLNDEWHRRGQARQMIVDFATDMGVEYIRLDGNGVPPTAE